MQRTRPSTRLPLLLALIVSFLMSGLGHAADKVVHRVRKGETLYRIAKQYGVTVNELASANKMKVSSKLKVGRRLVIPIDAEEAEEDAPVIAQGPDSPGAAEGIVPEQPSLPILLAPVDGPVISPFASPRGSRVHKGIDIKAPDGTPIRAAADGIARVVTERFGAYGRLVILEHPDGVATYYAHNQKNLVTPGQEVRAGDIIALVGRTGNASCDHLHFEVRVKGAAIDPEGALASAPVAEVIRPQAAVAGQQ